MEEEPLRVGSLRITGLVKKLRSKAYRDAYVASHTRQFLARQVRALRGDLSQMQFAAVIGKRQTVVSRLEDPNYGKWTLQTLLDVARRLDVAVLVRLVDFPTFIRATKDMSAKAASPQSYDQRSIEMAASEDQGIRRGSALTAFFELGKRKTQAVPDGSAANVPAPAQQQSQPALMQRNPLGAPRHWDIAA